MSLKINIFAFAVAMTLVSFANGDGSNAPKGYFREKNFEEIFKVYGYSSAWFGADTAAIKNAERSCDEQLRNKSIDNERIYSGITELLRSKGIQPSRDIKPACSRDTAQEESVPPDLVIQVGPFLRGGDVVHPSARASCVIKCQGDLSFYDDVDPNSLFEEQIETFPEEYSVLNGLCSMDEAYERAFSLAQSYGYKRQNCTKLPIEIRHDQDSNWLTHEPVHYCKAIVQCKKTVPITYPHSIDLNELLKRKN